MTFIDLLRTDVNTHGTKAELYLAITFLSLSMIFVILFYINFIRKVRQKYSLRQSPLNYYFIIYNGILFIILNELIILISIILSDQKTAILAREKSLIQIIGYGFFLYGWTNVVLFNISINKKMLTFLRLVFLAAMAFYIFAVIITFLITFNVIKTEQYLGIGYESAALVYVPFLLMDLVAMGFIARSKSKLSNYQAWIGILMFLSLLLQILSIIFNIIPVLIYGNVPDRTHAIFNFLVEPFVYLVTTPLTLLFLSWVLFNPPWLNKRIIETHS